MIYLDQCWSYSLRAEGTNDISPKWGFSKQIRPEHETHSHDTIMPTAFVTFFFDISCSVKHPVVDGAQGAGQSKGGFTHDPPTDFKLWWNHSNNQSHIITASFYRPHILHHTRSNRVHICTHGSASRTELVSTEVITSHDIHTNSRKCAEIYCRAIDKTVTPHKNPHYGFYFLQPH